MVKDHIQIVMRLLGTQFQNERQEKDFDSNIRILLHAQAIKNISHNRTFNLRTHLQTLMMRTQNPAAATLSVTEVDMMKLEDELLKYAELTKQPVTLTLPVKSKDTCWNSLLTPDQKKQEIFIGKCGGCEALHEHPKCEKCKNPRTQPGQCSGCQYTTPKEEVYQGYCGNCFQIHEFPNCVQCLHYRMKPGRCTNCGAAGPDDWEPLLTCMYQYNNTMQPILTARKKKVAEQSKKFTTYRTCPLCPGYFHSAKASLFRKHVRHVNELQKNIDQLADEFGHLNISGQMILHTNTEKEQFFSDDSSEEGDYEVEDAEEGRPLTIFEQILKVVSTIQHTADEAEDSEEEDFHQDHEDNGNDRDYQSQQDQNSEDSEDDEDQDQQNEDQMDTNGSLTPTLRDDRKFEVFGDKPDETACELTKKSFTTSICKVLPDTAEFPEDIFNIEGCVWCGSKEHDVYNCLGYATWLGDIWLGPIEERRLPYPQRQKRIEEMLKAAKDHYHNPRRPWELYVGYDDGEYLTEKGVKIQIRDMKIVNLIPRHLQTTTTIYADLPTAQEISKMLQLSTTIQPAVQSPVMEELCNQAVCMREEIIDLEVELKRSLGLQIADLKKDIKKELCGMSTLVNDRLTSLPQQLVSLREYLSKSLVNLHQRSLQSDLTLVRVYRELTEAKTPESCMVWRKEFYMDDPTYHLRGRWRQLSDRLNFIAEYTLRNNLVVPITGNQYADELRDTATLIGEVMYQMFQQAGILEKDDVLDFEEFWIFQETVSRTMQMQAIRANQICNFIRQILYFTQCTKKHFSTYMDLKKQMEVYIAILIQTTVKTWDKPGNCKCDFTDKLNCKHSRKYSILRQHFPAHGLVAVEDLLDILDAVSNQTCECSNHAKLPMHGPSRYIKAPIPTYSQLQQMHQELEPNLTRPNRHELYVRAISSWIYSRLYQYLTPYTDPAMNKKLGPMRREDWEFYFSERHFIENQLCTMNIEIPLSTIWEKLMELGDLKKTYCQCMTHQEDREINLLYQLRLHNTAENRQLINRVMKAKPLGFTAVISSCQQIIGTASKCNQLLYEVTPTTAGTFEAVEQHCRPQPHLQVKNNYCDLSDNTLVHVCRNQQEELSIHNLLTQVKGEPMVENATDGIETFMESTEGSESFKSTSSSGVPNLADSYHSCQVI